MSVQTKLVGGILSITLARPEKKNALDIETLEALLAALRGARNDDVRVIILRAEGDVFCGGGDITVMKEFAGDAQATLSRLRGGLNQVVLEIRNHPCPIVCAVQGNAYGAGAILAFQCDLTIASEEAGFAMSFRHVGLIPDTGGTWLLPRVLGMQRAKHLVWTGAPFTGTDAATWGLILKAVPKGQVAGAAQKLAEALRDGPRETTALAKRALTENLEVDAASGLDREARLQAAAFLTAEHAEGRDAFFARRRPAWP